MVENCIFCRIIAGDIPTEIIYRDDLVSVFHDQHPAAPVHLLVVPNRHITSLNRISEEDEGMLGHLMVTARRLAEQLNISQSGYRLLVNTGNDAGQTVYHLHMHILGGEPLPRFTR